MTAGPRYRCDRHALALAIAGTTLLAACATVPPDAGTDPKDPYEKVNRQVFEFNDTLDRYVLKPVAKGYKAVVPDAFRLCISSFFANLGEIKNAVNDILQAKFSGAATDTGRLVINSTLGVGGCFDVATKMGLERRSQDFGLTFANWGAGTGPYLVLPLFGPSDLRDGIGLVPDAFTNPVTYISPERDRYILFGAALIDTRTLLLDATDLVDKMAIDKYRYTRDAYLQRRTSLQYEGNPPPPSEEDDTGDSGPGKGESPAKPAQAPPQDRQ